MEASRGRVVEGRRGEFCPGGLQEAQGNYMEKDLEVGYGNGSGAPGSGLS